MSDYQELCESLTEMFPQAYGLALKRIMSDRTIFFDRKNKALESEELIFASLLIAHALVSKLELRLRMVEREKRIWNKHFAPAAETRSVVSRGED